MEDIRKRLRNYFSRLPAYPVILLVLGIILMAGQQFIPVNHEKYGEILLAVGKISMIAGIVLILLSITVIFLHFYNKPKDDEVDEQIAKDLLDLKDVAREKLGIKESEIKGKSIFLWSPLPEYMDAAAMGGKGENKFHQGKDKKYRFAKFNAMILLPTAEKLGVFVSVYDLLEDVLYKSETAEYQYKDIISLHTIEGTEISITFSDQGKFNIAMGSQGNLVYNSAKVPFVPFDDAVVAVRGLINDYRKPQ